MTTEITNCACRKLSHLSAISVKMQALNKSFNQSLQFNESLVEDVTLDAGYQIVVPLLIGLAMTGFLLNSIILVSILSSSLLMKTRSHDKYLNIIISMVSPRDI